MKNITVSCLAGSLAELFTLPLDTVTRNVQNNQIKPIVSMKNIYKICGIGGFYRSLIPSILRSGTSTGIRLGLYQNLNKNTDITLAKPIIGGLCGLIAQIAAMPFDVVRSQIQGKIGQTNSVTTFSTFNKISKNYGIKGFYKGYRQTFQRSIIISSIQAPVYFTLKDEIFPKTNIIDRLSHKSSISHNVIIHNISVIITTIIVTGVVYPIDLCKTISMNNFNQKSSRKIISELFNNRGFSSVYRGISTAFIRSLPHFWLTTTFIRMLS